MTSNRFAYDEEEEFFVDMEQTDPDHPELGTELTRGDVLDLLNGLEAALADAKNELSKAAMEINCAGPIDHRIRVLKKEHAESLVASQAGAKILRELLEKESLFDDVFIERFHRYSSHDRGCTWDDATKGDVCTCGYQALVSEFFEIRTVKKAAVDERELLEPPMLSQNIFLYGMTQLPVASSRTKPYEPFLTWAIEFAASEKREEGLRDIVNAGLVLAEGIGTEIGTSPLPPHDPDFAGEDALMALAIEFKSAALEALKEPKT